MQFQWHYTVDSNFRAGKWHLSSDEMVPGAPAGTTMHMDYWEAWSPLKAVWEKNCINGHLTCASGDLGDTTEIKGAGMPVGGFPKHQLVALSDTTTALPSTPTTTSTSDPTPVPTTQTCPDGSVISSASTCPSTKPGKALAKRTRR